MPRSAGAAVVLCIAVASILGVAYALSDDAARLADELAVDRQRLRQMMHEKLGGKLQRVVPACTRQRRSWSGRQRSFGEQDRRASRDRRVSAIAQFKAYLLTGTSSALAGDRGTCWLRSRSPTSCWPLETLSDASWCASRVRSLARRRVTLEVLDEVHDQVNAIC